MRLLLLCLVLTVPIARATADSGPMREIETQGFGLYAYHPPGWDWGAAPLATGLADARAEGDGCRLSFTVPLALLPGLAEHGVRFGIATGVVAGGPIRWLAEGETIDFAPESAPLLGQAQLVSARFTRADEALVAELEFATPPSLESAWDLMGLIDADANPDSGYRGGEWLLQNCQLGSGPPAGLAIAWLECRPGIALPGQAVRVTGCLANEGAEPLEGIRVALRLPQALRIEGAIEETLSLQPGEARWLEWRVNSHAVGAVPLTLSAEGGGRRLLRTRWLSIVPRRDPAREFQNANGDWRTYPERPTLQEGNATPLAEIVPRPPFELQGNLFGITTHLPRSFDDEQPFIPAHAVDGDPATCWASRWWRVATPLQPEWLRADLGRAVRLAEVRFLPAWLNSGAPASFRVETSLDGEEWSSAAERFGATLADGDGAPLSDGRTWQAFRFPPREARFVRLVATRLNQGATSFYCAPFEPFQFRIAELAALDEAGVSHPFALAEGSTTHHAWYNTPETVTRTWPLLLQCGVKLNRIGQWGDKTDWASVERVKGVYRIPPEVDRALEESHRAGVETVLTLAYGNNLYQRMDHEPDPGPTWWRGHPFVQCAPTTPEAVEAFARYCGFMAAHFRGTVRYFEVWNEENGWFFDDWSRSTDVSMARAYGRALKAAAIAIKEANPEAVVVFGGTAGSSLDYTRIALEEGAGPLVDVFAFHPYGHPTPEAAPDNFLTLVGDKLDWRPRPPEIRDYEEEIAAIREVVHRYNPRMAVWANEMNWMAPGEPPQAQLADGSELSQAKYLARFYTQNAWLGCGAVWWSMYNANGVQEWAVTRSADCSPRPAWRSAQFTSTVLDGVTAAEAIDAHALGEAPADLKIRAFRNGRGETLLALWRTSPADDACRPEPVTLRVEGAGARGAELLDLLYGSRQRAQVERDPSGLTLTGLLVGDWPLVVRLTRG